MKHTPRKLTLTDWVELAFVAFVGAALSHYEETQDQISRLQRRAEALRQFLNGETVSHPDALLA